MKNIRILSLILVLCATKGSLLSAKEPPKAIIAYVFVQDRLIAPDEIAPEQLTVINYAFANIKDGEIIEGFQHDAENFRVLNALKKRNPQLKILVSVGGWTWSGGFSDMALTRKSRRKFIDSAVRFVYTYQLDGVDIDWEYPGLRGFGNTHRPEDKKNFTLLMKELRARLNREQKKLGRHLITSIATGAQSDFLAHTEMDKVQRYVDTVNLMTYDLYVPGSGPVTGHNAGLFTNPEDPKLSSADASVKSYMQAGVPARKIVLGVPFYGRAWAEVESKNHGLYQPGKAAKMRTNYKDIVQTHLKNGFIRYWDTAASAPYLYDEKTRTFISYEDVESMKLKCKYVNQHKLGGIMFWEYHGDDNQALLKTINQGLREKGALLEAGN